MLLFKKTDHETQDSTKPTQVDNMDAETSLVCPGVSAGADDTVEDTGAVDGKSAAAGDK